MNEKKDEMGRTAEMARADFERWASTASNWDLLRVTQQRTGEQRRIAKRLLEARGIYPGARPGGVPTNKETTHE